MRLLVVGVAACWFAGVTLLLDQLRWFRRRRLRDRLAPYVPGGAATGRGVRPAITSFRQVIGPLAAAVGERVARAVGVGEPLAVRLERVHSPLDATGFRVHQLGWAALGLAGGAAMGTALPLPGPPALLFVAGGPLLGFLVVEQRLAAASDRWKQRIVLELPVVAEQLGMLLGAGYSLGAALGRLADRGKGACGRDLERVRGRIRQGLSEVEALREWAAVADVPALHRLVGVLALNRQAGDLGRLVSEEARAVRRDLHRQLVEAIERRAQQVWIPVTVAALVPGVIFLAVPFVEALRLFAEA
ncbi:MAG TPA: type II secretion system F family protein [Acidimicrobiales bacterium]